MDTLKENTCKPHYVQSTLFSFFFRSKWKSSQPEAVLIRLKQAECIVDRLLFWVGGTLHRIHDYHCRALIHIHKASHLSNYSFHYSITVSFSALCAC